MKFMKKYNNIEEWLKDNYFSENGFTFTVVGNDTFTIKDTLKKLGFHWHPFLQWHKAGVGIDEPIPAGYKILPLNYKDYAVWNEKLSTVIWKEDAKEAINQKIEEAQEPNLSEYLTNDIGTQIRDLPVILQSKKGFSSTYGWTNLYTFIYGNDVLAWFTSSNHNDLEVNNSYKLTGTIKKKEEYNGAKTTYLSRCIIK